MKRFFSFCCAILGMGATMYGASADLSEYLGQEDTGSSSSFTITTNSDGSLTFSGSYTDTTEDSDGSYSVSFNIAATSEDSGSTYTVTMSNFAISGSLSSAFTTLTAKITGITQVDLYLLNLADAIYTQEGNGFGTKEWDLTDFIGYFDTYKSYASLITVKITCTSGASIEMTANSQTITCGFTVGEDDVLSFSADGLENIFDTLTVEGEIVTVEAGDDDITDEVVITESGTEEGGEEKETVVVYESDGEIGVSVMLSDDSVFWTLFQAEDTQSLTLTVVMDNSNCSEEIGYGNLQFGGNYDGTIFETNEEATAWLSSGTVGVTETDIETIVLTVDDISDLFNAKATASWDLGAKFDNNCAWGPDESYTDNPPVAYLDGGFEIENLHGLQLSVFNSSKLVLVSYTYLGQKPTTSTDEGTSTAISNVNVEVVEVARYNLMGQKISGAEKGINIIVYSDGSAKKVLIK